MAAPRRIRRAGRADLIADAAEHSTLLDALIAQDLTVVQSLVRGHSTDALTRTACASVRRGGPTTTRQLRVPRPATPT